LYGTKFLPKRESLGMVQLLLAVEEKLPEVGVPA
jgi:hypothetical protein